MAIQRNHPFGTTHLRISRRRFTRRTRLPLALFLIIALPTLILLPGYTFSARRKVKPLEGKPAAEVLPPPHPPQHQPPVSAERPRHSQSHRTNVLEEDSHVDRLTIHPATSLNITVVVLFHNEYPTLNHTLYTWGNLLPHVSDLVFFLNGAQSETEFREKLPVLKQPQFANVRIIPSPENLALGLAITQMVRHAKYDNVLLLEKDWALVEDDVADVLSTSVQLLQSGVHVVRLRHRQFPGAPLHARMMHDGREESILREQPNLFCFIHHWIRNPVERYPKYFTTCPGLNQSDAVWCATAKYCQWTNNPALFKKQWFLEQLGERFVKDYEETSKTDPRSHMLDFEFYTNWKAEVWNDREFVVALPRGLFEHQEVGEGGVMNTVWYAWTRLQKDVDDKRKEYLEQAGTACEGRDVAPDEGLWRFDERYPIDFVRQYSYPEAMKRTVEEGVSELRNETLRNRERLEDGHGTWRNGVTDLTNLWYKVSLFAYPSEPANMDIAFVTALFHTEEADDGGKGFRLEVEATAANLDGLSKYRLLVYCTIDMQRTLQRLLMDTYGWTQDNLARVKFVTTELEALLERLLTTENVNRIKKLRLREDYLARVRRRTTGIPSLRALGLAHAKPYILDDALGHLDATHLVWFDGSSPCVKTSKGTRSGDGERMSARTDSILRSQLFLHAFVTGVPVTTEDELEAAMAGSGFDASVFREHMEKAPGAPLGFVDMMTLAGSRMAIALMTGYYDVVLRDLLRADLLGTGREALSIARNNVDYHFQFFNGLNDCPRNFGSANLCRRKKLGRAYMEGGSDGCQLYRWIGECTAR